LITSSIDSFFLACHMALKLTTTNVPAGLMFVC
jgi:hypothetical protein